MLTYARCRIHQGMLSFPIALFLSLATIPASAQDHGEADTSPMLIRDAAVRVELKLSGEQANTLDAMLKDINHTLLAIRDEPPATAEDNLNRAMNHLNQTLKTTLSPTQYERLNEIILQVQGAAALLLPAVAKKLSLSHAQQQQLRQINRSVTSKSKDSASTETKPTQQTGPQRLVRNRRMFAVLTDEQTIRWNDLLGQPFDFSQVQPIGVFAPEFENATAWINSPPLTMALLRGQVVVVHFYTFGCGNCIANFPSYRRWQETFSGKGVTIVGIHTPETEGERDVETVRRKAAKSGLTFPILVDNDKSNWLAWSNKVWPSVYLIDRTGRVHAWWYGELNWKGAQGEQRMRATIEKLLKQPGPDDNNKTATTSSPSTFDAIASPKQ